MDTMQPPDTPTTRMQDIMEHLGQGRFRVASLRLLALDAIFFSDLSSHGDVETLWQAAQLFQCLVQNSYTRSFSIPVDRTINKFLLHATMGCESLAAQYRGHDRHEHVRWLHPSEMKTKDILEVFRCFLGYITVQDAAHPPVKDANLADARRRLQRLCPRISNLTAWTSSPELQTPRTRRARANPPHTHHLRPRNRPEPSPTPTSTIGRFTTPTPLLTPSLSSSSGFDLTTPSSCLLSIMAPSPGPEAPPATVPTQILTTPPQHRFAPPLRTPALRMVNGMFEEVTQPFEISWSAEKFDAEFPPTLSRLRMTLAIGESDSWKRLRVCHLFRAGAGGTCGGGGVEAMQFMYIIFFVSLSVPWYSSDAWEAWEHMYCFGRWCHCSRLQIPAQIYTN